MKTLKGQFLPWIAYPGTMAASFGIYALLAANGVSALLSSYVAVLFGATAVTALEFIIPYDPDWQPKRADVKNDLIFMLAVQMALPQMLTLFAGVSLVRFLSTNGWTVMIWPHDLPLAAQVVVMLLVAEFFRYWLHVASHRVQPLWRLHAVHHSPHKLYWLNVGRFHPIEKALQYMFDMLPFILVGVNEAVLALYFVFYAVNGFHQHSNVNAKKNLALCRSGGCYGIWPETPVQISAGSTSSHPSVPLKSSLKESRCKITNRFDLISNGRRKPDCPC